jgi:hypothetical protein
VFLLCVRIESPNGIVLLRHLNSEETGTFLARETTERANCLLGQPDIMVEAGGVEPPSEKPCHPKTTCLARSEGFAGEAQSEQDAPPASPIILPARYGPKRASQPTV